MDEQLIEMMLTAGKVRVTYGVHDVRMKVAGLTVGQLKIAYADVLNFSPDAPAYLGVWMIGDSVALKAGDHIENMKAAGWKGSFARPILAAHGSTYLTADFLGPVSGQVREWAFFESVSQLGEQSHDGLRLSLWCRSQTYDCAIELS